MVDMSASNKEDRLSYLMQNGRPFLTIVYIGGHVLLYMGNYQNPNKPDETMAMTYQNIWGLKPNPPTRRAVIGQSVIFPMLLQYPEDTNLISLAGKQFFQVSYLDQLPNTYSLRDSHVINIKSLMYPDVMETELDKY